MKLVLSMFQDAYSDTVPISDEAALAVCAFLAVLALAHQLRDEKRRVRMAKRFGAPVSDVLPWLYARPWLDSLFEIILSSVIFGGVFIGGMGTYLVTALFGLEISTGMYRAAQVAGIVGYALYFAWRHGPMLNAQREVYKVQAQESLKVSRENLDAQVMERLGN